MTLTGLGSRVSACEPSSGRTVRTAAERCSDPRTEVVVHEAKQHRRWRFSALDQPRTDQLGQYPRRLCRTGAGEKGDRAQIEIGSSLREDGEYSTLRTWDDALHGSAKVHASA